MEERDDEAPIKSVRKAMDILDVLSDARRPLRISDIAAKLNMSMSAVSRLITTLSRRSLVHQDEETGRCYLGLGLAVLSANALGRRGLDRIAMPVMDELANRIHGYVSLGRLSRGKVVIMRAMPAPFGQNGVNIVVVAPTHACAPGKILCGALSDAEILAILTTHGTDPITTSTITDPAKFLEIVDDARRCGYAIDNQESSYQTRHVACPILDHDGNLVATLSAGGPATDFPWSDIPSLIQALNHGCLRISRELGYLGDASIDMSEFDENRYREAV